MSGLVDGLVDGLVAEAWWRRSEIVTEGRRLLGELAAVEARLGALEALWAAGPDRATAEEAVRLIVGMRGMVAAARREIFGDDV